MPLVAVPLRSSAPSPPQAASNLMAAAEAAIEAFLDGSDRPLLPAFVPSDFGEVYAVLAAIRHDGLAPGRLFCEWGSGFGVVAALAAQLGFRACGIEIEPVLVAAARELARDFHVEVEYVHGSFIPAGGGDFLDPLQDFSWLVEGGPDGYDELCRDPDEFDVIFAYPWPGEEHVIEDLFEHFAATGALLVTHRGREGTSILRKA